ncbi:MAG TPA: hypothetical protein VK632_11475, partial [Verrucomicrobiae bacterium]|nr:hypothetical protein [Verrucomicrobiae bacterium]
VDLYNIELEIPGGRYSRRQAVVFAGPSLKVLAVASLTASNWDRPPAKHVLSNAAGRQEHQVRKIILYSLRLGVFAGDHSEFVFNLVGFFTARDPRRFHLTL